MKKIFLILTALFMSVMTMAEEKTLTFDLTSNPGGWPTTNPTTLTNYTFTLDGVDYTFGLKKARYNNNGYLQLTRPAALGLPAIEGYRLTNVVAKNSSHCATDVYVGISVSSETENYISGGERQNWVTTNSSYTYELNETSNNTVYYLYVTSSNAQVTEITLTYERDIPFTVTLDSIVIKGAATKMAYEVGEAFDPAGLEVWGLYTKYVKNDSTSQIKSGITWSINPETFTTVSSNASVTLSASYKDKTSSDTTITGINVSNPVPVDYLCFTADAANSTIELKKSGSPTAVTIQYQVNGTAADGWTSVDFSTATTTGQIALANVGDKVYFRNASSEVTGFSTLGNQYYRFVLTGSLAASGNVMSLVDKSCQTLTIPGDYCFYRLFYGCDALTTAPSLPATTLAASCYQNMFYSCDALTAAPELPATIMATLCYSGMFQLCTTLTVLPALPATTLADYCYQAMFRNCYALTTAPELPATTLANSCYSNMFYGCSSLTTAPALPATTLTNNCYYYMFDGCSSLTTAPALPATALADYCYSYMFRGCSSLVVNTTGPGVEWSIPAGAMVGTDATYNMFYGTGGDFTGVPTPGTTYYIASATIPVSYLAPAYNTVGDPTSGIAHWDTLSCTDYSLVENTTTTLTTGWYVVTGTDVQTCNLTCNGAVNLILADGAKLTATSGTDENAGITVSGNGNSLTVYAQSTDPAQMGTLFATGGNLAAGIGGGYTGSGSDITINGGSVSATGGESAAGIGGGDDGSGSDITINGGSVTATGGESGAGIGGGNSGSGSNITINGGTVTANARSGAAGIGGGIQGHGSNITINGGSVTANGGVWAAGIGGGASGSASNIFVATNLIVQADNTNPPTTVITNTGADLASSLNGSRYATVAPAPLPYLCFTAEAANSTIELTKSGSPTAVTIQYQVNGTAADGWTSVDFSTATTTGQIALANVGDKVYFRNASSEVTGFSTLGNQYYHFAMTGSIAASGNVMSLVDKSCQTLTIPCNFCFTKLFQGCTSLTTAPALPATTLDSNCYQYMFSHCSSLTAAPELPATIMATRCYQNMFEYCDSLTAAPALPATTLATYCYSNMFNKCYALMTAPALPATTLADYCYQYMFFDCDSLTTAPALPATTLAANCYGYMFANCASLTTAPALPATTLTDKCYQSMFALCASLTTAPALPATTLTDNCYQNMFAACSTLVVNTTAPGVEWSIPAGATGSSNATSNMFSGTGGDFTGAPAPGTIYYIYSALSGFTITANVNDTAMGSVTGAGNYTAGSTATLTATAKEGYRFSNWTNANGGIVSTANPWTLTVASDTTVTANFVPLSVEVQEEVDVPAFAYDYALGYTGASSTFDTSMVYDAINCYAKKAIVYGYNPTTDDYIPRAMSIYDGFFSAAGVPTAYNSTSTPFCIKFYNDGTFWYCTHPDVAEYDAHYTCSWILVNPTTGDAVQYNFSMNDITRTATITANVNNTAMGSASGSGTYNIGSTATLTATPAAHYHFVNWSNGSTVNPLTITVEKDSSLTANFAIDQHAVATFVNNATMGEVTAGGTYDYGTQITLTATPAAHYHFVNWSNGSTSNPLTITVEKDSSLTANFAIDQHAIATFVNNATMGEVTAGGTYDYGTQITLTATPAAHYHFVNWSNGSTVNPLTITVEKDSSLTANFAIDTHTVTLAANDEAFGTVEGAGTYNYGTQVTAIAVPAAHYHFVNWSNGETNDTIVIDLAGDTTLTANFAIDTHLVTLAVDDVSHGIVEGAGIYDYGTQAIISATADPCYHFVSWNDGVTDNPRFVEVESDTAFTANFELNVYESEFNEVACDSYTWDEDTYILSGDYQHRYATINGCDSTATLHLVVNYSNNGEFSEQAAFSYIWDGREYTESGNYTFVYQNVYDCDSTVTLHLTIASFELPVIDQLNKKAVMLSHYPNGDGEYVDYIDYRWYRDGELVAEGFDNFWEPSVLNGCYHVEVPVDETKTQWVLSNELCFQNGVLVGIDEAEEAIFSFSVAPNPVAKGSSMTITAQLPEQQLQGATLMMFDLNGRIVTTMPMSQQSVTLPAQQTSGIYVIQITTRSGEKHVQRVVVR